MRASLRLTLLACVVSGSWAAAVGCSSSSDGPPAGAGPSADASLDSPDVGTAGTGGGGGSAGNGGTGGNAGSGGDDAGVIDANDDGDASIDASDDGGGIPADTVTLAGVPQRLVANTTTNVLYAMLSNGGPPGGIVAVDMITRNVLGTLSTPVDGGGNILFDNIAVDSANDLVFAGAFRTVYVFDGTTRALLATVDLSGIPLPSGSARLYGMAADGVGKKLYVILGYFYGNQQIAIIDVSTPSAPVLGSTPITLTDIVGNASPNGEALVIDTKTNLLFACGLTSGGNSDPAADVIDTTTNTQKGSQLAFAGAGTSLDCKSVAGFAALVTNAAAGGTPAAQLHALEPIDVDLPAGYTWQSYSIASTNVTEVNVFGKGKDSNGITHSYLYGLTFCGEQKVGSVGPIDVDPGKYGNSVPFLTLNWSNAVEHPLTTGGKDIWVSGTPPYSPDGGVTPSTSLLVLHLDASAIPGGGPCP